MGTLEAKSSVEKLISKYDKANRTGVLLFILGMPKGDEKKKYLELAIDKYGYCLLRGWSQCRRLCSLHIGEALLERWQKGPGPKALQRDCKRLS